MSQYTTRSYEFTQSLATPLNPTVLKMIFLAQNMAIFGIGFAFVYGVSYGILNMMAKTSAMTAPKRENMLSVGPILLATPYWTGVLVMMRAFPFEESVFWALTAWSVFVDAFVLLAAFVQLVIAQTGDCATRDEENGGGDAAAATTEVFVRVTEKELAMDVGDGLGVTSPPAYSEIEAVRCEIETGVPEHKRNRVGSVTRIWSDAVGAHGVYSEICECHEDPVACDWCS